MLKIVLSSEYYYRYHSYAFVYYIITSRQLQWMTNFNICVAFPHIWSSRMFLFYSTNEKLLMVFYSLHPGGYFSYCVFYFLSIRWINNKVYWQYFLVYIFAWLYDTKIGENPCFCSKLYSYKSFITKIVIGVTESSTI